MHILTLSKVLRASTFGLFPGVLLFVDQAKIGC
jgi:hypothetical protein